jgi:hypothetical protein
MLTDNSITNQKILEKRIFIFLNKHSNHSYEYDEIARHIIHAGEFLPYQEAYRILQEMHVKGTVDKKTKGARESYSAKKGK